jgi:uncharacterized LabA/DUF88 family protein
VNSQRPTAIVYVDGLNLYRQKLRFHDDLKWLNLVKLCELMLPTHQILKVRYFTALITGSASSGIAKQRQGIYIRALETLKPQISIHFGKMVSRDRKYLAVPKSFDVNGLPLIHKVKKTEEKGTDTAIAAYMAFDATKRLADLHALISSDSDFEPVLRLLHNELGSSTALFSPTDKPATSLQNTNPLITRVIRKSLLSDSQFPNRLKDSQGEFEIPAKWKNGTPPQSEGVRVQY